jgi:hypothetical protein
MHYLLGFVNHDVYRYLVLTNQVFSAAEQADEVAAAASGATWCGRRPG